MVVTNLGKWAQFGVICLGVCFRRVAKFGIDNSTMLMLVCQVFSRTSITTVLYFGALDYLY